MSKKGSFQEGSIPGMLDAAADDVLRKLINDSELPGSWAARAALESTDIIDAELRELHGKPASKKSAIETIKRVNLYTNPMTSAAYTAYMATGFDGKELIKKIGGNTNSRPRFMIFAIIAVIITIIAAIVVVNTSTESFYGDIRCQPKATRFSPREALGGNSNNISNVTVAARTKNVA